MAIGVGDIIEVTYQSTLFLQKVMTVLHYRVAATPTQQDPIQSQNDFLQRIKSGGARDKVSPYVACISNQLNVDTITAQYIAPTRIVRSSLVQNVTGSLAGSPNTANVAATLEKTTQKAGRKFRGSIHLPGIRSQDYASGLIQAAELTLLTALGVSLQLSIDEAAGTGLWFPVIWHRTKPVTTSSDDVLTIVPKDTVRVMRRRTVGVGK